MISEYKMFRGHFIGRIVNLRSILEIYDITYDITFVEDTLGIFQLTTHLMLHVLLKHHVSCFTYYQEVIKKSEFVLSEFAKFLSEANARRIYYYA